MEQVTNSFIYVFDAETKDKMIALSFTLLKEDVVNGRYVFVNDGRSDFAAHDIEYVLSDTLTF